MTRENALKACPFCEGHLHRFPPLPVSGEMWVICYGKNRAHPPISMPETAWNTRASGWEDIATAPHAVTVLACRFDADVGEWVCAVVLSPPSQPFTHWTPLPSPPGEGK